ncbi:MAG TPA: tetratricopeptide repeat protein, partial [Urbifossiella sp.]
SIHFNRHNFAKALADLDEVLKFKPDDLLALGLRSMIYSSCPESTYRNGAKAFADALKACELSKYLDEQSLSSLGAAYAELGKFAEAIKYQKMAIELDFKKTYFEKDSIRLKLYEQGKPYRITKP